MNDRTFMSSDPIGFGELYERFRGPLTAWCRKRFAPEIYETADLVHDTFGRLIQARFDSGDELKSPFAYLCTIAKRLFLNKVRALQLGPREPVGFQPIEHHDDAGADSGLEERLERSLSTARLRRIIATLPKEQRHVIRRYLADQTYAVIAANYPVRVSINKVQKDLQRALDHISRSFNLDDRITPQSVRTVVDYGSSHHRYRALAEALLGRTAIVLSHGDILRHYDMAERLEREEDHDRLVLNWCATRSSVSPLAFRVVRDYVLARTCFKDHDELEPPSAAALLKYVSKALNSTIDPDEALTLRIGECVLNGAAGNYDAAKRSAYEILRLTTTFDRPGIWRLPPSLFNRVRDACTPALTLEDRIAFLEIRAKSRWGEHSDYEDLVTHFLLAGADDLAESALSDALRAGADRHRESYLRGAIAIHRLDWTGVADWLGQFSPNDCNDECEVRHSAIWAQLALAMAMQERQAESRMYLRKAHRDRRYHWTHSSALHLARTYEALGRASLASWCYREAIRLATTPPVRYATCDG